MYSQPMLFFLSYEFAHIWACPPSEGDDYVFHCHPVEQKIPKPKRLQDWYRKMLDKAVVSCKIKYRSAFQSVLPAPKSCYVKFC